MPWLTADLDLILMKHLKTNPGLEVFLLENRKIKEKIAADPSLTEEEKKRFATSAEELYGDWKNIRRKSRFNTESHASVDRIQGLMEKLSSIKSPTEASLDLIRELGENLNTLLPSHEGIQGLLEKLNFIWQVVQQYGLQLPQGIAQANNLSG